MELFFYSGDDESERRVCSRCKGRVLQHASSIYGIFCRLIPLMKLRKWFLRLFSDYEYSKGKDVYKSCLCLFKTLCQYVPRSNEEKIQSGYPEVGDSMFLRNASNKTRWDLRFSRQWGWWCSSSGFWRRVDWSADTNVSEKHTVSILRAPSSTLKMDTSCFSETLASTDEFTRRLNPEKKHHQDYTVL
jgi:hypothetical protein